MRSLHSYFILFIAIIYWLFRVIVSLMDALGNTFMCVPLNINIEIALLFITIPCIVFIIRRNIIAATLYFGAYAMYFGTIIYNSLIEVQEGTETLFFSDTFSLFFSILGLIIPLLVFFDVAIEKSTYKPREKHTDWYYDNDKYEREFDQRADRNQYKIK